jgi:hypothetical protein
MVVEVHQRDLPRLWVRDQPSGKPVEHLARRHTGDTRELVEGLTAQMRELPRDCFRIVRDGVQLVPGSRILLPVGAHHRERDARGVVIVRSDRGFHAGHRPLRGCCHDRTA